LLHGVLERQGDVVHGDGGSRWFSASFMERELAEKDKQEEEEESRRRGRTKRGG
jgi:hypothetical protein